MFIEAPNNRRVSLLSSRKSSFTIMNVQMEAMNSTFVILRCSNMSRMSEEFFLSVQRRFMFDPMIDADKLTTDVS